jgi:tRNA threonylcarbamoyladenosine biosynthesis protein TsaB
VQNPLTTNPPSRVLVIDTCLNACQAAVSQGGGVVASRSEPMSRGHQERLAPMIREVMTNAGLGFADLDRIGVTVGPGSFTGLRVGLAFAKGLALALGCPCVGIGALEALAASEADGADCAAVIDAGRGRVFLQLFSAKLLLIRHALTGPDVMDLDVANARLLEVFPQGDFTLIGPGAALLAGAWPCARLLPRDVPETAALIRLAAAAPDVPARPLYLRAPDATPKAMRGV